MATEPAWNWKPPWTLPEGRPPRPPCRLAPHCCPVCPPMGRTKDFWPDPHRTWRSSLPGRGGHQSTALLSMGSLLLHPEVQLAKCVHTHRHIWMGIAFLTFEEATNREFSDRPKAMLLMPEGKRLELPTCSVCPLAPVGGVGWGGTRDILSPGGLSGGKARLSALKPISRKWIPLSCTACGSRVLANSSPERGLSGAD